MGVNSLPITVTRQRRDCDSNPGPSARSPARYPLGYRAIRDNNSTMKTAWGLASLIIQSHCESPLAVQF